MIRASPWLWVAGFVGFCAAADVFLIQERPAAELAVEMQGSEASQAKVFFDTGSGYNERESVSRFLPADSVTHRLFFPLPAKTVRSIRFDPSEVGGIVQIRSVTIQKPDSHTEVARFDLSKIAPLNEIESITQRAAALEVKTVDHAVDPQLLLPLQAPLTIYHSAGEVFSRSNLRAGIWFLLLAIGGAVAAKWWPKVQRPIRAVNALFDECLRRSGHSSAFAFDRTALWFYSLCVVAFVLFSLGKFHGSSISIAGASYRAWTDVAHTPLLGTPKKVRSDEWSFHTPTILNQAYRRDSFTVNDTLMGPGKAALLGNIPCRHFTQLFRPQFWGFFVLPADMAFSVYWQGKALILLTGVFTLLLIMTRSSAVAALCALWFFLSAFTQWAYSWASLLPEMVGLFCWAIALTCYLTVGRNRVGLFVAGFICASCAINFALCAYPPHQLPLVAFGLAIVGGWFWSRWGLIWRREARNARLLALFGCWLVVVGAVMIWFYLDAKETLLAAAGTVYPGQRSSSGGGVPVAQFLSHFFDFWKSEENFPPSQWNICEASGYLWLAPVTLLLARPPKEHRHSTALLVSFWLAFLLLLSWMLFPIPAKVAHWVFFERVPPYRCYHALGLINITIVGFFIAERKRARKSEHILESDWPRGLVAAALLIWLFFMMNKKLDHFFSMWSIAISGLYVSLLICCLVQVRRKAFAALLLVPLALTNGLINPLDRGLEVITASSLFKAAHGRHDDWRDGKWLIYAPWADEPGLLAATGIDVVDCLKIVPDRKRMGVFDSDNRYAQVINRSSYFIARPLGPGQPGSFESPSPGNVLWWVDPLDPRLRLIGVDRVAFAYQPPSAELSQALAPLLEETLPGLKVYHLR
jgi:hypothetical protein